MLGEVDWSVVHEDALTLVDFFFRRTDLGLGPREVAEDAVGAVADRMGTLLDWDESAWRDARAELTAELDLRHGWRADPTG
jgi:glycerol-3-phosphate dehydrogenase